MGNERDVFEWRRFGHWTTSAEKAWFAAYLLWHMRDQAKLKKVIRGSDKKNGEGALEVIEAFRRKRGVALNLFKRPVFAGSREPRRADPAIEGVPANHDIPSLWSQASLPDL